MAVVALLTDFGLSDPYVGEMKAVILRFAPTAVVVDVTHGISPGGVREAAWVLCKTWSQFPPGTCHVAVVDPGVGSDRRALAATAGGHFFVGPDNGLLAAALDAAGSGEIREITTREIEHRRRGTTFDGRDVFAPVAARLVTGFPAAQLGPEVHDPVTLPSFAPRAVEGGGWETEVVRRDRFGNVILAVEEAFLRSTWGEAWRDLGVRVASTSIRGVRLAYEEVEAGEPLVSIGGAGTLEISVRSGSAAKKLGLKAGDRVRLDPPEG
ncbi:MAG: SAM-dependent chlorinase/fluorinase [bacterium]